MKQVIILLLCSLLSFQYDWSFVDQIALQAIQNRTTPSIVLSVATSNKILYTKAYGKLTYQNDLFATEATLDTKYDIASLSKIVGTLTSIQRLYDLKKLDVDDLVIKFIPQYNNNGKGNTTLRNLLLHNAGLLPDYPGTLPKTAQQVLTWTYNCKLETKIGTKYVYSDLSFILLGDIVQRITGTTLDKYSKSITDQILMKQTGYNPSPDEYYRIAPTQYDPYVRKSLIRGVVHDPTAYVFNGVAGHAGVFSTLADLTQFMQMHLNGGQIPGQSRILSKTTVDKFTKLQTNLPYQNTRALGWDTVPIQQYPPCGTKFSANSYGHTGFTGTSIWADKDKDLIIVMLFNRVYPTASNNNHVRLRSIMSDAVVDALGF